MKDILVVEPDHVVVKLNRRPPAPRDRPLLLLLICGPLALGVALLTWLAPGRISPLAAVLLWLALSAISFYSVMVEATFVATPAAGAFVEYRWPVGTGRSRIVLCPPGLARSVAIREKVDLESDIRPFTAFEIVAETPKGSVVLCVLGAREPAVAVARAVAAVLGCAAQVD